MKLCYPILPCVRVNVNSSYIKSFAVVKLLVATAKTLSTGFDFEAYRRWRRFRELLSYLLAMTLHASRFTTVHFVIHSHHFLNDHTFATYTTQNLQRIIQHMLK